MDSLPHPSELFAKVEPIHREVWHAAAAHHATLTKPAGSLGRYEELGEWLAACQGECPPHPIHQARVVVFAGDHGVARHDISAYPPEVSVQIANNIHAGGAGINVLAHQAGVDVRLVDVSLDHDVWGDERVSRSCGSIDVEDAMSNDELIRSLQIGQRIADQEADRGVDILIPGDVGIGNTTPAAALVGVATRNEPVVVVGRGTGIGDEAWKRKVSAVRDAMFRVRSVRRDPMAVLKAISSPDLAAMAGFLAQAAVRRVPVILDGVVSTAVALWARRLAPGARQWWVAGHISPEPAHRIALDALELTPLLDFGMRLGEGTGGVAALPLVRTAAAVMNDMATFEMCGMTTAEEHRQNQSAAALQAETEQQNAAQPDAAAAPDASTVGPASSPDAPASDPSPAS